MSRHTTKGATIIERKDLGGLFGTVQDSGMKLSDGSAVFAEIKPPPAAALAPGLLHPDLHVDVERAGSENDARRVRRSWRNTLGFGIGEAI